MPLHHFKIRLMNYTQKYINNKVTFAMLVLTLFFCIISTLQIQYQSVFSTTAHAPQTYTASFFNDRQRMITGGQDGTVKVWSLADFSILHTFTYGVPVFNVALHPTDNRIFILISDGNINIYNPTTYAQVHTFAYPGTTDCYPGYLVFDTVRTRFIVGGYDGTATVPQLHFYNSATYAFVKSVTTSIANDDQIITISINAACTHIVIANKDTPANNIFKTQVYDLSNDVMISSFTDHTNVLQWALFDNTADYFCSTSMDLSIRCYNFDSVNNVFVSMRTWSVSSRIAAGDPYCMNFGIPNHIIVTVGPTIVFFDMTATPDPNPVLSYTDPQDIFVLDSTPDMGYLVSGMRNGVVSIWKKVVPNNPVVQNNQTVPPVNIGLIVGLVVGILVLVSIIGIIIYCCLWGAWSKRKKKSKTMANDQLDQFQSAQNYDENQNRIDDKFIIIAGDDDNHSNSSSQPDYDQLMCHGTVMVIKDEKKKRQYLKKLNKKKKKNKKNKKKKLKKQKQGDQLKEQQHSKSSISSQSQFDIEGNIIIIRDQNHPIKNLKNKKKNNNNSETSSDMDYNQLMAEGNIIIIKDEQTKKKFVQNIKKNNKSQYSDQQLNNLLIQGTVIVIKGQDQQKKFIKQIKKDKDIQKIQHDQLLAHGDIIVIKDEQKKKVFIQDLKKQVLKTNNTNIINNNKNNNKLTDLSQLQIAQQIIVIRGQDDINNDQDQQLTYEQLTAQGTVIIIKDQQVKKQYIRHKLQNKNKNINNDDDQQPDYQTLMAEQCVIVIKDQDDKREYVDFVKSRKIVIQQANNNKLKNNQNLNKDTKMDKNTANLPPISIHIKNKQKAQEQKNNNLNQNVQSYQLLHATGGAVIIKQTGQQNVSDFENSSNIITPRVQDQTAGIMKATGGTVYIGNNNGNAKDK